MLSLYGKVVMTVAALAIYLAVLNYFGSLTVRVNVNFTVAWLNKLGGAVQVLEVISWLVFL